MIIDWSHVTQHKDKLSRLSLIYDSWHKDYDEIVKSLSPTCIVETHQGLPATNQDLPDAETNSDTSSTHPLSRIGSHRIDNASHHLILIDDVVQHQRKNDFISQLFTVHSHHSKVSVILIVQSLFTDSPLMRTLARNSDYLIIMQNVQATATLLSLQKLYFPSARGYLTSAAQLAFQNGYRYQMTFNLHKSSTCRYLIIDMRPLTDAKYRLKSGLLKNEVGVVFPSR